MLVPIFQKREKKKIHSDLINLMSNSVGLGKNFESNKIDDDIEKQRCMRKLIDFLFIFFPCPAK